MKNNRLLYILLSVLFVWLLVLSIVVANKKNTEEINEISQYNVSGFSTDLSRIYDMNKSSIVTIEESGNISSGFIYSKKDDYVYIVTSYHGVSDGGQINVHFNNGIKTKAILKAYDIYSDMAVLECEFDYDVKTVTLGNSSLIKTGEFVLAIGCKRDLEYDFSSQFALVSNKYREIENNIVYGGTNHRYYIGLIQLAGDLDNGYSGCPVFNMAGEVVGLVNMKDDDVVFALPINEIKILANKMIENQEYKRNDLGIKGYFIKDLENYEIASLDIPLNTLDGYYVENILNNSIAYNLGIQKGDIVISINSVQIIDSDNMLDIKYADLDEIEIIIIRNGEELTLRNDLNNND